MSYEEDQREIRRLALLCMETRDLTDEEIEQIIDKGDDIGRYFYYRGNFAGEGVKQLKRYRARRVELDKLSTEELDRMMGVISQRISAVVEADYADELPDSFYEAPPIDSDSHILCEILVERKKKVATTA